MPQDDKDFSVSPGSAFKMVKGAAKEVSNYQGGTEAGPSKWGEKEEDRQGSNEISFGRSGFCCDDGGMGRAHNEDGRRNFSEKDNVSKNGGEQGMLFYY